jgi:hypothetical protein
MEGTTPAPVVTEQPAQHPGSPEHHIHRQPRDFSGKVNGAPRPGGPPAPKQEGSEVRQPGETAAQAAQRQKFAYKANGKDYEEELTQEEVAQRLSREKAAYSKFEDAARLRKEAEQREADFASALEDPKAFQKQIEQYLQKKGMSAADARLHAKDHVTRVLAGYLDEDDLSPEQRELRDLRAEREEREREEEESQSAAEVEKHKESVRAKAKVWANKIGGALQAAKDGGLPVTDAAIKAMSGHLSASMRNGVGCTEAELVEVYREDLRTNVGATIGAMDFADLRRLFPDVVKKVHAGLRAEVQQRKAPGARPLPISGPRTPPAEEGPVAIASDDFAAYQAAMNGRRGR